MKKITFFHEHIINKCLVSKTKLLFMLLFVSSLSFAQLPTDAVAKYTFTNGSLINVADAGNGDLTGGAVPTTLLRPDRFGNANNAIRIEASSRNGYAFTGTNNNISVSFWMAGSVGSNTRRVLQVYDGSGDGFHISTQSNTTMSIRFKNSGAVDLLAHQTSSPVFDGNWHHVVVTLRKTPTGYDNNVYIDGVLNSALSNIDTTNTSDFLTSNATFVIAPGNTHYGNIDDIELFDRALTANDVQNVFNNTTVAPSKIYVNSSATGNNDGSSWVDAYTNLQVAFGNIGDGGEIWIASGTYKPAVTDRSTYFHVLQPNVSIYGGFAGTEASIDDRVIGANETKLSGDLQGNDVNVLDFASNYANSTRNADNSYRIIAIQATGDNLLLDGLTISDAHTNIDVTTIGGAIYKHDDVANLTLRNCLIKDNVSRNFCAGVYADFSLANVNGTRGSFVVDRCQFTNNMSRGGSGLYNTISANTDIDISISNTIFEQNVAADLGSNKALSGSGMWFNIIGANSNATLKIYNNTFVNNLDTGTNNLVDDRFRASLAISGINNVATTMVAAEVANCIFWNNLGAGDATSTNGLSRAISDMQQNPITSLNVYNCLDSLNFVEGSITNSVNTVTTDPLFTDMANGDYTLTSSSPAINSGDNNFVFGNADLLGNQRIFNTTVDMGVYEFGAPLLGINDFNFNENQIKLYPNPSTSVLNIEMTQSLKQATIYSIFGAEVLKTDSKTINTTHLKTGMYIIKIVDDNGFVSAQRFVKN